MRENFDTDEMFEPERAELGEKPRYRFKLNRRHFLEVTGAGLLITAMVEVAPGQRRRGEPVTLAARLHIAEDGTVTILTGKVEIGQGSRTQITQAAAEEMGIPAEEVRLVMADTKLVPNDGATSGSRTTPRTVPSVRKAAAAAREILVAWACAEWNTQPNRVELVGGAVRGVLDVGSVPESAGNVDEYVAGGPVPASLVRGCIGGLEVVVESSIEIEEAALAAVFPAEVVQVGIGDAQALARREGSLLPPACCVIRLL